VNNLNDYYLIYLYREGSEIALNLLFKKYEPLIYKEVKLYNIDKFYFEDCLQIGRIALFKSIETFNESHGASFYTFFKVVLYREIYRSNGTIIKQYKNVSNYMDYFKQSQNIQKELVNPYDLREALRSPEELDIFDKIITGEVNVLNYAKEHKVKQSTMYLKTNNVKKKLRKYYEKIVNEK